VGCSVNIVVVGRLHSVAICVDFDLDVADCTPESDWVDSVELMDHTRNWPCLKAVDRLVKRFQWISPRGGIVEEGEVRVNIIVWLGPLQWVVVGITVVGAHPDLATVA
jgi:hypothetical protein